MTSAGSLFKFPSAKLCLLQSTPRMHSPQVFLVGFPFTTVGQQEWSWSIQRFSVEPQIKHPLFIRILYSSKVRRQFDHIRNSCFVRFSPVVLGLYSLRSIILYCRGFSTYCQVTNGMRELNSRLHHGKVS